MDLYGSIDPSEGSHSLDGALYTRNATIYTKSERGHDFVECDAKCRHEMRHEM